MHKQKRTHRLLPRCSSHNRLGEQRSNIVVRKVSWNLNMVRRQKIVVLAGAQIRVASTADLPLIRLADSELQVRALFFALIEISTLRTL